MDLIGVNGVGLTASVEYLELPFLDQGINIV